MKRLSFVLVSLLLCSFVVFAAGRGAVRKQVESSTLVTGTVEIEPDGSVSRFGIDHREQLSAAAIELVEQSVPGWKFEPVLVQGKPAKATAKMTLRLVAKKLDDKRYNVQVRSATFGEDKPGEVVSKKKMSPPTYPSNASQSGVAGTVYLILRIGRQGQVEDAIAEQVNLKIIASENEMKQWRRMFAQSAVSAAKRWTFNPPTSGDNVDEKFWSARVPVNYAFYDRRQPTYGEWEVYVAGPRQRAPWVQEEPSTTGGDAIADGSVHQIGNGFRLLTPLGQG